MYKHNHKQGLLEKNLTSIGERYNKYKKFIGDLRLSIYDCLSLRMLQPPDE